MRACPGYAITVTSGSHSANLKYGKEKGKYHLVIHVLNVGA